MFLINVHLLLSRKKPIIFCTCTLSRDVLGPIGFWVIPRIWSASRVIQELYQVLFAALSEEQQKMIARFLIFGVNDAASFILIRCADNCFQRVDVLVSWVVLGVE